MSPYQPKGLTAAKRQVYGYVAIDQVAGPSEIAVLTDGSVAVRWIAAAQVEASVSEPEMRVVYRKLMEKAQQF